MDEIPTYRHTQKGLLGLLLYVVGAAFVVAGAEKGSELLNKSF